MGTVCRFASPQETIQTLIRRNRSWAKRTSAHTPSLFPSQAHAQSPHILWIGCSDSRVPETSILDLLPGELFVHRNIANLLPANDLSSLSVIQYAMDILKVQHIIICGHYGCGGIQAAMCSHRLGLIDNWLKHIRDVRDHNRAELSRIADPVKRANRLVELNVLTQVRNLKQNSNVLDAMERRGLEVHGFVYDVGTGHIHNLDIPKDSDARACDLPQGAAPVSQELKTGYGSGSR